MTWYLAHPDDSHYTHPDGRRWPRVSTVVAEWQRCAMNPRIPKGVLQEAANLGTNVHAAIAFTFGKPPGPLPSITERSLARATVAGQHFHAWRQDHRPTAHHVELRLTDDEDEVVGTADWVGELEGVDDAAGPGLIDWKTGALYLGGKIALAKYLDMANNKRGLGLRWAALVRLEKDAEHAPPYYEMKLYTVEDLAPALRAWSHLRALNRLNLTEC